LPEYVNNFLVAEFRYPFSALYLDYKGRLAHSLLDTFPSINFKNNDIEMHNDKGLMLMLTSTMAGIARGEDEVDLDDYCALLQRFFVNTTNLLEIGNKITSFVCGTEYSVIFSDNDELTLFYSKAVNTNWLFRHREGSVNELDFEVSLQNDNKTYSIKASEQDELNYDILFNLYVPYVNGLTFSDVVNELLSWSKETLVNMFK